MRINCLSCGHNVDLDEAYDDYEGPIKCFACRNTLEIHAEQGMIKVVKLVNVAEHPAAEQAFEPAIHAMRSAA